MLVFLLPIFVILFYFYPKTTDIIKKEAQNSETVLLSQINDYVSIQVNALFNCASAIHLDRDVTSNLFFKNSEFNTLLIMQEMRKILGTNPFIERAFLYSASNGKFYSHSGTINGEDFFSLLEDFDSDGVLQSNLLGIEYIISVLKSDSPSFTYVSLTPVEELLSELNKTKIDTLFLVFLIVAVCLIIICLSMRLNYRPINIIKKHILSKISEEQDSIDDFQLIHQAILNLQNENKELVNRILLNKNIVSEYFLIQFVNGNIDNRANLIDKARDYNIILKEKVCCLTFYAVDRNTLQLLNGFNELLKMNSDLSSGYLIKGIRHEDFILILTFDEEDDIKQYFEKIYSMLSPTGNNVKIGVGTVEDVYDANKAYIFSLVALENAILEDDISILFYDEIDLVGNYDLICFFDYVKSLEIAIYRNDTKQMRFSMDNIIKLIKPR